MKLVPSLIPGCCGVTRSILSVTRVSRFCQHRSMPMSCHFTREVKEVHCIILHFLATHTPSCQKLLDNAECIRYASKGTASVAFGTRWISIWACKEMTSMTTWLSSNCDTKTDLTLSFFVGIETMTRVETKHLHWKSSFLCISGSVLDTNISFWSLNDCFFQKWSGLHCCGLWKSVALRCGLWCVKTSDKRKRTSSVKVPRSTSRVVGAKVPVRMK